VGGKKTKTTGGTSGGGCGITGEEGREKKLNKKTEVERFRAENREKKTTLYWSEESKNRKGSRRETIGVTSPEAGELFEVKGKRGGQKKRRRCAGKSEETVLR